MRMPTARPGGSMRCTSGTSMRLEVNTGMETDGGQLGLELGEEAAVGGDRADALALEEARALDEARAAAPAGPGAPPGPGEAPVTRW